jgi:hypothetical protein
MLSPAMSVSSLRRYYAPCSTGCLPAPRSARDDRNHVLTVLRSKTKMYDNADFQESSPGESFVPTTSGLWHAEMLGIDDIAPARRSMNA